MATRVLEVGETCMSAGWIRRIAEGQQHNYLREVEVQVVDISICKNFYGEGDVEIDYNDYICTEHTPKATDNCMVSLF